MARDRITVAGKSIPVEAVPLIEPERNAFRQHICQRDVASARAAIVEAYARLDQRIRESIVQTGLVPACHKGCAWCCHGVKVTVSIPEALAIAEYLEDGRAELVQKVEAASQRRRHMNTDQYFFSGETCPFLSATNDCSIYDVRPMACRRHCCLDSSECERAVKNPKLKLPVSQHAPINALGALSGVALAAATEDARLDYRTFELATAVCVALRPDTARRWVTGERVFDEAVRPVDNEDREIAKHDLKKYSPDSGESKQTLWKSHSKKKR